MRKFTTVVCLEMWVDVEIEDHQSAYDAENLAESIARDALWLPDNCELDYVMVLHDMTYERS